MFQRKGYPAHEPRVVVEISTKGIEITRIGAHIFKRRLRSPQQMRTGSTLWWMKVPQRLRYENRNTKQYDNFMELLERRELMVDHSEATGAQAFADGVL